MTTLRTTFRTALAPAVALVALLAGPTAAHAAAAPAAVADACTDPAGVTVVVDLTDLGGQVEVGCADAAATGTEALAAAGFVETRDASGMICAIDALPDPCPAEFTGSYWSYWFAEPGGEWQTYMEGSDTAVPVAGNVEGWRYNDGSQGPGLVAPVAATSDDTAAAEETGAAQETAGATASPSTAADETITTPGPQEPAGGGPSTDVLAGLGLLAVLAVAGVLVARRRSGTRGFGPPGQD